MATDDIVSSVKEMRKRGVEFLSIPEQYYDTLVDRVGSIDDIAPLQELGILVDRDEEGYLLKYLPNP